MVLVEPSGAITLVECKLRANPEIRRAVIGQIMAYAANLWKLSYESLDQRFHHRLGSSLAEAVAASMGDSDLSWDEEAFRAAVAENLHAGRFRLVIAVDEITDELKRSVEFINTHTTGELQLLALELGYVADEGVEILLPKVHGEESARLKATQSQGIAWTVEDVVAAVEQTALGPAVEVARRLIAEMTERGCRLRTGRGQYPTVSGDYPFAAGGRSVWAVYGDSSGPSAPRVAINFGSLRTIFEHEQLESLLQELETIEELQHPLRGVRDAQYNLYPSIPLATLAAPGILERFLGIWDSWIPKQSGE